MSQTEPEINSFTPDSGVVGTEVTILGVNFKDVTSVKFNGIPSKNFIVDSEQQIRATVPETATDGFISVIAAGGEGVSDNEFVVLIVPGLTISSPNGGEQWLAGSSQNITWDWTGFIDQVKLEYSLNGGLDWNIIENSTNNDGY